MKLTDITSSKTVFMPIGPSGSGKSTLYRTLKQQHPDLLTFSLDNLRHEWYDSHDYAKAWQASVADKEFRNKANARFIEMIKSGKPLYIDNTNLTPKGRKFYLNHACQHGYKTVGIEFSVDLQTLIDRQKTRGDKQVPEQAVRQQFNSLVGAQVGEFDEVIYHGDSK